MDETYQDPLDPASERFAALCKHLNCAARQDNAKWSADVFSGGFKFSDEFPTDYEKLGEQLPSFVDLLRCLWGYRASLVMQTPRQDLAGYWEAAKAHAPNWAGFSSERSSAQMKPRVAATDRKVTKFIRDMDRMDRELEKRSRVAAKG